MNNDAIIDIGINECKQIRHKVIESLEKCFLSNGNVVDIINELIKSTKNVSNLYFIYKLERFILGIKNNKNEKFKEKMINKLKSNKERASKELFNISLFIDKYNQNFQTDCLATIVLSYFCEELCWDEVIQYANAITFLSPKDIVDLKDAPKLGVNICSVDQNLLRLQSVGLIFVDADLYDKERFKGLPNTNGTNLISFKLTNYGDKLVSILTSFGYNFDKYNLK